MYLKAILVNASDKSNRMLRAKSMECISLVGMAVGKDKFKDDAKQVTFDHVYLSFVYSVWTYVIFSKCCHCFLNQIIVSINVSEYNSSWPFFGQS